MCISTIGCGSIKSYTNCRTFQEEPPLRTFADLCMTYRVSITCYEACELSTSFPGSFLYFEKVERGPWERGWRVVFNFCDSPCCCFGKTLDICTWNETVGKDCFCTNSHVWFLYLLISLFHIFDFCRKPGLAEPEKLKFGCSK